MEWNQRDELDDALEGFDRRDARDRRVQMVRSLSGGEVVMASKN